MRFFAGIISAIIIFAGCSIANAHPATTASKDTATTATVSFPAPGELPILTEAKEISAITANHGSDLLVVNLWATFCAPCVEEMPYFVELSKKYPEKRIRVIGFSADLKSQVESAVKPFLKEKKIPYANYLLFVVDQQQIIDLFAKEWDGGIPVTFFYNKSGKQIAKFLGPLTQEELNAAVEKSLKQIDGK